MGGMVDSRKKGRRYELEVRKSLREAGLDVERIHQEENADDKPDLEITSRDGRKAVAIECKVRGKQLPLAYLIDTLEKTIRENPTHDHHSVVARLDRTRSVAIIPLEVWTEYISRAIEEGGVETKLP